MLDLIARAAMQLFLSASYRASRLEHYGFGGEAWTARRYNADRSGL